MKSYILIVFLIITSFTINAQVDSLHVKKHGFCFGVDVGMAAPKGDFASGSFGQKNPQNSQPFYLTANAMAGFHYDVYGGFRFYKSLGIMIEYGANTNSYSQSSLNNPNDFTPSGNGTFNTQEYLAGPFVSFAAKKIRMEAKLLLGKLTSNYPTLISNNPNYPVSESFQDGEGNAFCFGVRIRYMIFRNRLGIVLGLTYLGSDVTYPNWTLTYQGFSQIQSQGSVQMSIHITQITLGVSLDL